MIHTYIHNIIKYKRWVTILFIGLIIIGIKLFCNISSVWPTVDHLLDIQKCPACYGNSACNKIHKIDIAPDNIWSWIIYIFGVKNVFFGMYGKTRVVLKKLAHASELRTFDEMSCTKHHLRHLCIKDMKEATFEFGTNFYDLFKKEITKDFAKDDSIRLRLCPNDEHVDILFQNVFFNNRNVNKKDFYINLWTLITINPEPLLLQILPADTGWPLPKYFGACGRIVIEEYVGLPLIDYYYHSWIQRAEIVSSLLNAAYMFTFQNEQFGFYLTDISVDNIAVDSKGIAKFIDLENVIVVDKNTSKNYRSEKWQELQENSENFDCSPNCLVFSSTDICKHRLSDHNYYAICQLILHPESSDISIPGGFLYNIPLHISEEFPTLKYLIRQCITPVPPFTRIYSGIKLKELLDIIVQKFK